MAVSVGLELPGTDRYPFTRGTVLGSGELCGTVLGGPTFGIPNKVGDLRDSTVRWRATGGTSRTCVLALL